ncbi:unnamed protein product [Prorocentrum cordatum]|uniref:Uncharacterized protein n=1 Tax=Prorocentrum cordatum TaxID=2364126 RepID=A0ABN9PIX7_9DINO|nr:unnamed protein product [Polarella glacialis]
MIFTSASVLSRVNTTFSASSCMRPLQSGSGARTSGALHLGQERLHALSVVPPDLLYGQRLGHRAEDRGRWGPNPRRSFMIFSASASCILEVAASVSFAALAFSFSLLTSVRMLFAAVEKSWPSLCVALAAGDSSSGKTVRAAR